MSGWPLLLVLLTGLQSPEETPVPLVNGDFQSDRGPFNVPAGWVPFGDGAFEGRWEEGNWMAHVANAWPSHEVGLYQVIPEAVPGTRYRLTARVRSGHAHLSVRIGLIPGGSAGRDKTVWSAAHTEHHWKELSAEALAAGPGLTAVLEMRNLNREHQLLQAGSWDDVRLTAINFGQAIEQPAPPPPTMPLARDVYASMANLWSLAWPRSGVRTFLAGTHHPDAENNSDFDRVEGQAEIDGTRWTVLKSFQGPGSLVRIWMTNFAAKGRIRIEVDGETIEESRLVDFFGSPGPFTWPLANRTTGAWMSYVPIPFTRSARVLVREAEQDRFYWQITWQRFDQPQGVRPFTQPLSAVDSRHLQTIQNAWRCATLDPKPPWPGTREESRTFSVATGETATLWSQEGSGMVGAFWIDVPTNDERVLRKLRLRATWDGANSPQVDAPLGLFFTVGYGRTINRGLLVGMAPPHGGYCYFPMPFGRGARLELLNGCDAGVKDVRFRIQWVPLSTEVPPMRFHAFARQDPRAGQGELYVPLEVEGRGHFVGLTGALAHGDRNDMHYLEGDEYFWVDGEENPSTAGTGTEDYFTCGWYFMAGPVTLAPIGATEVSRKANRVSAYRLHVPDWVPFEKSFKFGLEVGDRVSAPEYGEYTTITYLYIESTPL
ncbi:MAG: hypothetical protein AMXMBFR13_39030 [Phycisphaerae bacterium]